MAAGKNFLSQIYVLFLAVASTAFVVTIYHCMIVIWRNRRQRANLQQQHARDVPGQADIRSSIQNSIVELIPTHKYEKGKGFHDGECPVCLSEFEEGDEVRTLPECMHSFHVDCIDMWLYSHPNCPMCRSNATPSPLPLVISSSDLGLDGRTRGLEFSMSQDLGVQHMAV